MRKLLLLMLVSCLALTVEAQTKKPTPSSGTTPKKPTTTTTKPSSTYKPSSTTTKPRTTTVPSNTTTYPSSTPTTVEPAVTPPPPPPSPPSSVSNPPTKSAPTAPSKPGKPTPEKGTKVVTEKAPSRPSAPKPPKAPSASSLADDVHARIGVKGGATNLFPTEKSLDYQVAISPSYEAGFVVNLPLGNVVSLQPEFLYTNVAVKVNPIVSSKVVDDFYVQTSTNFVNVPLMINFNFGGDTKFMLNLGGYGSYALSSTSKTVDNGKTVDDSKIDYKDSKFEDRTDYGAAVGVGVKFNQKFFVEARGYQSLKSEKDPLTGNSAMPKQVVATLSLGYFF
jgi:hypothetical protein